VEAVFAGKRQVIDIPPIVPIITEHRIFSRQCTCGHCQTADYPTEAHSNVCYGKNIISLTAYFHARQYVPYNRMREMYCDIFGLDVCAGSLANMVQRFAEKAQGIYEMIRQRIAESPVVGGDETGACIAGKNRWARLFQTPRLAFIDIGFSRAKQVIDKLFPNGFPDSTLNHDCWKPYFKVNARSHQICTAHLLRELKYPDQIYNNEWSADFTLLLKDALHLKSELSPTDYLYPMKKRKLLEKRLDDLLQHYIDGKYEKMITFQNRIKAYRQYLFQFLYQHDVPPDNNASERGVRTFKVKQKISGLFRSVEGAKAFAVIRSIIDTILKNGQNVLGGMAIVVEVAE
jgi:hypothetical protein